MPVDAEIDTLKILLTPSRVEEKGEVVNTQHDGDEDKEKGDFDYCG